MMAPRDKEQFTVVCDGLFLNDTKPENWAQSFPWKPSVGFHYFPVDENYQPTGEIQKTYPKDLWLFQAMGGKNAKGKYFEVMAEHGVMKKEGAPDKPWVSIMPIAEVFSDGTSRFIKPPKDGKVGVPGNSKHPTNGAAKSPQGANNGTKSTNGGTKPPTNGTPPPAKPAAPTANTNGEKLPPIALTFIDQALFVPQSDPWWAIKGQTELDGAVISNAFHYATIAATRAFSPDSVAGSGEGGKATPQEKMDSFNELVLSLAAWYETTLRNTKALRTRERFGTMLGLCSTPKQVAEIVNQGWVKLPKDQYDALKEAALLRLDAIKKDPKPLPVTPTPGTPDVSEEQENAANAETAGSEEDIPF